MTRIWYEFSPNMVENGHNAFFTKNTLFIAKMLKSGSKSVKLIKINAFNEIDNIKMPVSEHRFSTFLFSEDTYLRF